MASDHLEILISDTLIPDIFIARYMPMLGKDAVNLYLWLTMTYKGSSFTLKDAVSYGAIPEEAVNQALAELVSAGVFIREDKDRFSSVDLKKVEIDEYVKSRTDASGVPVMRSDEKKRNLLATSIQQTFYQGAMPYAFYRLIDTCLYDYHFEDNVVYALFEEGKELRMQYIVAKMEDLARRWFEKGFTTADALKEYYDKRNKRSSIAKMTGRLLRRHLTEMDYERFNKWVDVYGADEQIVEYAIRVNEWRSSIKTLDIEQKLKEWYEAGVFTIDKATVYEAERAKENKSKVSRTKGRTNVRKSGKEAGITADKTSEANNSDEDQKDDAPIHDSILDMFSGGSDEDDK